MIFWTLLGSLGLGGIATVAGLFFVPDLTLRILSGAATVALGIVSKLASRFFSGCEWIFQRKDATFALFVFMLVAGYVSEKYDPVSYVLHWSPGKSEKAEPQRQSSRQPQRPAPRESKPVQDTFDYIRRSLNPF